MAIGDLDNDQHVDIVTMDDEGKALDFHYYDSSSMDFDIFQTFPMDTFGGKTNYRITSVMISQ